MMIIFEIGKCSIGFIILFSVCVCLNIFIISYKNCKESMKKIL